MGKTPPLSKKKKPPCLSIFNKNYIMGTFINKAAVVSLVKSYITHNAKKNSSAPEPEFKPIDKEKDALAVWFSKEEIDELFKRNEAPDKKLGVRIYFGMHEDTPVQNEAMGNLHKSYIGKNTVVLVCTHDNEDCFSDDPSVALSLDEGHICPPPRPCGGILESEL